MRAPARGIGILLVANLTPKVSVLIRTMGRPSLLEAVNSVRSQSFTDWELIVVNASGTPLTLPPHESWSAVTLWIETGQADSIHLGEVRLDEFLSTMSHKYVCEPHPVMDAAARAEAQHFNDSFLARLEHFLGFAAEVYGAQDALLRSELGAVVRKTFAATAGSALAYYCLSHESVDDIAFKAANRIREELTAGV